MKHVVALILSFHFFTSLMQADVKSTNGQIKFDIEMDNQAEMILNGTGLGIGTTPSTNLHVIGNTIVTNQVFVGGESGSSNFNLTGAIGFGFQSISSNTVLSDYSVTLVDSSADNITVTLPYAGNVNGRIYIIKKISTSNFVWVSGGGNLIDDTGPIEMPETTSLPTIQVISDGSQWRILDSIDIDPIISSDNLVGWWKLDDFSGSSSVEDSSQNSNTATVVNIASSNLGLGGKINQAIDFDGSDDYLNAGSDGSLRFTTGSFTLSAWIYPKDNRTSGIISSDNNNNGYSFMTLTTGIRFLTRGTTDAFTDSTSAINLNQWQHLAVVCNMSTNERIIYLNGTEEERESFTGTPNIADSDLLLGVKGDGTGRFWGLLDDLRVYNKALSGQEIRAIFSF